MRQTRQILWIGLLTLIIGGAIQPLYAFDPKETLKEADTLYSQGDRPEKALELYTRIIKDGSDNVCVILSKLKTAYIYEEQLMDYDKSVAAYELFMTDYPDSRLSKIVRNKVTRIQELKDTGELDVYRQFKLMEQKYQMATRMEQSKAQTVRKEITKELYAFTKENYAVGFKDELIPRALNALAQEGLFLEAHLLIRFIEKHVPEAKNPNTYSYQTVQHQIKKAGLLAASKIIIGLCVLLVLTGRGFKRSWVMVKEGWVRLLAFTLMMLTYMVGYHIYVRIDIPDAGMENRWLYYVLTEFAILIPFSILLFNSFPYIKKKWLRYGVAWVLCVLLGISTWVLFAHRFNFLLETRM